MSGILVVGAAGVGLIWLGRRRRWLDASGALAALVVGGVVLLAGGVPAAILLGLFFLTASSLTRFRAGAKPPDGREHVPPGSRSRGRSARQVLANSASAAGAALLGGLVGPAQVFPVLAGCLAAATADSWATEVGTAFGGTTRLLTTWRPVAPGTSGGVSVAGSVAGLLGAATLGFSAALLAPRGTAVPSAWATGLAAGAGGIGGMLADSLVGATWEGRQAWLDNEAVNLLATVVGGLAAWLVAGRAG